MLNHLRYRHEIFVGERCGQKFGRVQNDCILMHWQIQGWHEDLRLPILDNPGSTTAAHGR